MFYSKLYDVIFDCYVFSDNQFDSFFAKSAKLDPSPRNSMHFYSIFCVTCPKAEALELSSSNLYSIIEFLLLKLFHT